MKLKFSNQVHYAMHLFCAISLQKLCIALLYDVLYSGWYWTVPVLLSLTESEHQINTWILSFLKKTKQNSGVLLISSGGFCLVSLNFVIHLSILAATLAIKKKKRTQPNQKSFGLPSSMVLLGVLCPKPDFTCISCPAFPALTVPTATYTISWNKTMQAIIIHN